MAVLEHTIVAPRKGDYSSIQDADDALDGGAYILYVKRGTYPTFTIATANAMVYLEPGVIITGAITLSGAGVCLVISAGCDIQGLITGSGIGSSVLCENGVDLDGVLASGARSYVTGGGWDTVSDGATARDGIQITADDCIVEDIACQTTAGGGNSLDGVSIESTAVRAVLAQVKVVDSDDRGILISGSPDTDCLVMGCVVLGADTFGMFFDAPRSRVIGNFIASAGTDGIRVNSTGDDSVLVGNIIQDQGGDSIELNGACDDCVVVANRLDGAITDGSTGSTVAQNDTTAF